MSEEQNAINIYTCQTCGWKAITKNLVVGTTPFMIGCEHCSGSCHSSFYHVAQDQIPTHEWFKPATDAELIATIDAELAKLGKRGRPLRRQRQMIIDETKEHVSMGGLLLRKVASVLAESRS